ncbi:MAG: phenylacetate--CoA ligase family protein [Tepidisphaeraceae bacterium]
MLAKLSNFVAGHLTPEQLAAGYRTTPPWLARRIALSNFRRTIRWAAKHSPFYREKFAEHRIDWRGVRSPADLGDFFTTPQDLIERGPDFLCSPPSIVFESSGTSGKNKRVFFDRAELREIGQSTAAGFRMMGIRPEDRVATAFDFSIWIPGLMTHYGLMAADCFCLAFGKVDPLEVYRRLELHRFTVVLGEPTWLIRLTEIAEQDGCRYPLRLLIGGAEEMPAAAVPWMQRVWQGAQVKMCYGSVEQGHAIGFQPCNYADGYHLDTLDFLPEMVDISDDGWGELVFTTLRRHVMPLIRYRTRDITRMTTTRCECGIHAPRIARIRGRRDELVVASGGNLYPKLFESILLPISGLTHDWQVQFKLRHIREVLEIHVETLRSDHENVRAEIFAQATHQYPDLMKNLALGIFEMNVVFHEPGTIRTGRKLKRLIDLRYCGELSSPAQDSEAPDDALVTSEASCVTGR